MAGRRGGPAVERPGAGPRAHLFCASLSGTWRQDYDALRYPSYGSAFREAASAYREGLQDLDVFSMAARFEGRDLLP